VVSRAALFFGTFLHLDHVHREARGVVIGPGRVRGPSLVIVLNSEVGIFCLLHELLFLWGEFAFLAHGKGLGMIGTWLLEGKDCFNPCDHFSVHGLSLFPSPSAPIHLPIER